MVNPTNVLTSTGSSPRGRGTCHDPAAHVAERRFIPARAGNIRARCDRRCRSSVHPRAGGEHLRAPFMAELRFGSSPRGRGTLQRGPWPEAGPRFIPARAGNMSSLCRCIAPETVHPRAGGEHDAHQLGPRRGDGSSPRGRGTSVTDYAAVGAYRFIPARAGNICRAGRASGRRAVHPRAGGEHPSRTTRRSARTGSSPRGRGTFVGPVALRVDVRFIPARAGNIRAGPPRRHRPPVHPRAGGEHSVHRRWRIRRAGSSPRGRGT